LFSILKKSKTIQGQQGDAMQNKFLRGYSKKGVLFIWGPKRGPIHGVGLTIFFVSFVV